MKYLTDWKNWIMSVAGSVGILLVNMFIAPMLWERSGANVTFGQIVYVSMAFFIARILWIFFILTAKDIWAAWRQHEKS